MQKQKKMILWPVYFDSSRTRKEGRRVLKNVAVLTPNLDEIRRAAERLGLMSETEENVAHPAMPWRKTGRIWVQKKGTKMQILMKITKEIVAIRLKAQK